MSLPSGLSGGRPGVMSDGKWMNMAHLQMIYQLKMVN